MMEIIHRAAWPLMVLKLKRRLKQAMQTAGMACAADRNHGISSSFFLCPRSRLTVFFLNKVL
jgi:hypothetical protein